MAYRSLEGKRRPSAVFENIKMSCLLGKTSGITFVVVGLVLALFSAGVLINFESVFRWILGKRVVLSPTSQGFPIWRDVSNHLDTRVAWYFFNLTNPEEFKEGEMPVLEEVGPFWYKANLTKRNIEFFGNASVNFEEHRRFDFDPIRSAPLNEDVEITMVNVPLIAAIAKYNALGYFARLPVYSIVSSMEQGQSAIAKFKIRELTYEGQPNSLMVLSTLKEGILTAVSAMSDSDNKKARFGFGIDKNMTDPGVFNMYTGSTGVYDLNRIYSMNKQHVLDIWPDDHNNTCNILDGTFGNLRPPMIESNIQRVFVPDMCHTITTRYQKDVKFHDIRLRRFVLTDENFEDAKTNPANSCYNKLYSLPSGVTEVGPCKKGAPIVMSRPHFMNADPKFSQEVKGMNPVESKHEFIMDHEPTTGMSVSVRGRLQANIKVEPSDLGTDTGSLPNVILPLFWQEMYVEAGPGIVAFLKKVLGYPGLMKIALIILTLIGLILAVIGAGIIVNHARKTSRSKDVSSVKHQVTYTKAPTREAHTETV